MSLPDRINADPDNDRESFAHGASLIADAMDLLGVATFGELMQLAKARGARSIDELLGMKP